MADVAITPQRITRSKLEATYTGSLSTTDTYKVKNDGKVVLHFKKTGAGECTVTVTTPREVDGLAVADRTFTVPATTGDVFAGPFPPFDYNDGDNNLSFTVSEVTDLSVAALRID